MSKKQHAQNDGQVKPAPAPKTPVEDLQPKAERDIRGAAGKVSVHDIPITHI